MEKAAVSSTMMGGQPRMVPLTNLNPLITCWVCKGYLIDPVATSCAHSFCKTCLVKHLDVSLDCPRPECDYTFRKLNPLSDVKEDKTLQDLVYKLVPGLHADEMQRRKAFFAANPPQEDQLRSFKQEKDKIFFKHTDKISLSIEYYEKRENRPPSNNNVSKPESLNKNKRYLQCPGMVKVRHLKEFVAKKYGLSGDVIVDVMYEDDHEKLLPDESTLIDVAYARNYRKEKPMEFMYRIFIKNKTLLRKRKTTVSAAGGKMLKAEGASEEEGSASGVKKEGPTAEKKPKMEMNSANASEQKKRDSATSTPVSNKQTTTSSSSSVSNTASFARPTVKSPSAVTSVPLAAATPKTTTTSYQTVGSTMLRFNHPSSSSTTSSSSLSASSLNSAKQAIIDKVAATYQPKKHHHSSSSSSLPLNSSSSGHKMVSIQSGKSSPKVSPYPPSKAPKSPPKPLPRVNNVMPLSNMTAAAAAHVAASKKENYVSNGSKINKELVKIAPKPSAVVTSSASSVPTSKPSPASKKPTEVVELSVNVSASDVRQVVSESNKEKLLAKSISTTAATTTSSAPSLNVITPNLKVKPVNNEMNKTPVSVNNSVSKPTSPSGKIAKPAGSQVTSIIDNLKKKQETAAASKTITSTAKQLTKGIPSSTTVTVKTVEKKEVGKVPTTTPVSSPSSAGKTMTTSSSLSLSQEVKKSLSDRSFIKLTDSSGGSSNKLNKSLSSISKSHTDLLREFRKKDSSNSSALGSFTKSPVSTAASSSMMTKPTFIKPSLTTSSLNKTIGMAQTSLQSQAAAVAAATAAAEQQAVALAQQQVLAAAQQQSAILQSPTFLAQYMAASQQAQQNLLAAAAAAAGGGAGGVPRRLQFKPSLPSVTQQGSHLLLKSQQTSAPTMTTMASSSSSKLSLPKTMMNQSVRNIPNPSLLTKPKNGELKS